MTICVQFGLFNNLTIWLLKQETSRKIVYEKLDNIKPENYELLKTDLEQRTGLKINKVSIGNINFSTETANVTIYYYNGK